MKNYKSLGVIRLTALIVNLVIGAVIFDLPQNMAEHSWLLPIMLSFVISGFAMFLLAVVLQILARKAPVIKGSIYKYSKVGFGNYVGFNIAFGYWISALIGNISFIVICVSALGYFFPALAGGPHSISFILAESLILWLVCAIILYGIDGATRVNAVLSLLQVLALITIIAIGIYYFNPHIFSANLFPPSADPTRGFEPPGFFTQLQSTLMVGLFSFIGIEGASLYANRARSKKAPIIATFLGFMVTLILLVSICAFSMALCSRADILHKVAQPSAVGVVALYINHWGVAIINLSVIISALGAVLSWTLLAAEVLMFASQDKLFSSMLSRLDKQHSPKNAILLSGLTMQLLIILASWAEKSYYLLINLCASVVLFPYLLTCLFLIKKALYSHSKSRRWYTIFIPHPPHPPQRKLAAQELKEELTSGRRGKFTPLDNWIAVVAAIFFIIFSVAQGLKYIMLSSIIYSLGIIIYWYSRKTHNKPLFANNIDRLLCGIIVVLTLSSVVWGILIFRGS